MTSKSTKTMNADMTDAQLLTFRPAGQSDAIAATRTWLWRTRERLAGRDPMRSAVGATKTVKQAPALVIPDGVHPDVAKLLIGMANEIASLKTQGATRGRSTPTVKAITSAPPHVQAILDAPDDELAQLEQLLAAKSTSKVNTVKVTAAHSPEALNTYINAGGKAARAFMKGEAEAVTQRGDMGLVPGLHTHNYASKMLQRITGTSTKPAGKARGIRGSTASQATKRASGRNPQKGLDA